MMRSTLSWLIVVASVPLTVTANHTLPFVERDTAYLDAPAPLSHGKRCAGPGCSAYPLDLSAAIPYVRFVMASSDSDAEGAFKGQKWTISVGNW